MLATSTTRNPATHLITSAGLKSQLRHLTSRLSGRPQGSGTRHERKIAQRAHGASLLGVTARSKRWLGINQRLECSNRVLMRGVNETDRGMARES